MTAAPDVTVALATDHLTALGLAPTDVIEIGAGHWSVCFGFRSGDRRLVVRFGHHREDFDLDRAAARFNTHGLPIPEVLQIGRAFVEGELGPLDDGCFHAISERVDGTPLEEVSADHWPAVVPSVVAAMEEMRRTQVPADVGWGGWVASDSTSRPVGSHWSWRDYILSAADEPQDGRIAGWEANLRSNRRGSDDFAWAMGHLETLLTPDVERVVDRAITHQDMINRNVHVADGQITGLFDWGCAAYADPLYKLALFQFWNPWHPALDVELLLAELELAWQAADYDPVEVETRLRICHLHIGVVHLIYTAYLEQWRQWQASAVVCEHSPAADSPDDEILIGGVNRIIRSGETVIRPAGPHTPSVHRLLAHVRTRGFTGGPAPLAYDPAANTETLSFVPGETTGYPLAKSFASDHALRSAGRLLRAFHETTVDFQPQAEDRWDLPAAEPVEVICHGDFAPYNCAVQGGEVTGMFDFDAAHPGPRLWDLGYAAYRWARLTIEDAGRALGDTGCDFCGPVHDQQTRRLQLFCDGYGWTENLTTVTDAAADRLVALVEMMRQRAADGNAAFARHIAEGHDRLYLTDVERLRRWFDPTG